MRTRAKKTRSTVLSGEAAVLALASPLRMEILQVFSAEGRLTVGELAQRIGKARGSLYYHVRKLAEIGVLVEADRHLVGRRYESVYEVAADRIAIGTDPSTKSGRGAAAKLVWSSLRQAGREFDAALESGLLEEREGAQIGTRQRAWLTDQEFARIQSLFERIEKICGRASARKMGHLYSVTNLVVPLAVKEP